MDVEFVPIWVVKRYDEHGNYLAPKQAHGTPFDFDPETGRLTVESFPDHVSDVNREVRNFVRDIVDYATHFHPQPGFSPGTSPLPLGGYAPVVPPWAGVLE